MCERVGAVVRCTACDALWVLAGESERVESSFQRNACLQRDEGVRGGRMPWAALGR
jgi:hypothetical protein